MSKILFIDILATGLNPQRCGVYALGGIICRESVSGTEEVRRFEMRIRPFEGARISDNSLWIGGVTRGRLIYFPTEDKVMKDLTGILSEEIDLNNPNDKLFLSGFNASAFDVPFLRELFQRNGNTRFRDYFHVQTIDLMSLAAFALMPERRQMSDFRLESAAQRLGVTHLPAERYNCLDNAATCLRMFRSLKQRFGTGEPGRTDPVREVYRNWNPEEGNTDSVKRW